MRVLETGVIRNGSAYNGWLEMGVLRNGGGQK